MLAPPVASFRGDHELKASTEVGPLQWDQQNILKKYSAKKFSTLNSQPVSMRKEIPQEYFIEMKEMCLIILTQNTGNRDMVMQRDDAKENMLRKKTF